MVSVWRVHDSWRKTTRAECDMVERWCSGTEVWVPFRFTVRVTTGRWQSRRETPPSRQHVDQHSTRLASGFDSTQLWLSEVAGENGPIVWCGDFNWRKFYDRFVVGDLWESAVFRGGGASHLPCRR